MTAPAFRVVAEDADFEYREGLGIPFKGPFYRSLDPRGRDSYKTIASPRTDLGWDLFPDRQPNDPETVGPKYVRPLRFHHGLDDSLPGVRLGGWSPVRQDDDGVWVRMQLDKRKEYFKKVRALLEAEGAGLSAGTIDYNMRYDARTGEWLEWPVWELSITPTESNPYAAMAARSAETIRIIEGARAELPTKAINDLPDSDFAYIEPGGTKDEEGKTTPRSKRHFPIHDAAHVRNALARAPQSPFGEKAMPKIQAAAKKFGVDASRSAARDWGSPALDAGSGASIVSQIYSLADAESDEPDQYAQLLQAASLILDWMTAEVREPVPDDDGMRAAFRAGRRNSTTDQQHLDAAHTAAHGAVTHTLAAGAACDQCEPPADEPADGDEEAAARSGETPTTLRIVEREDPEAVRAALLSRAETVGADVAKRLVTR